MVLQIAAPAPEVIQLLSPVDLEVAASPEIPNGADADAGVEAPEEGALQFSSSLAAIQAAIDGHGVILGRSALIDEELKSGRLVAPFDKESQSGYGYYVVTVQQAPLAPRIEAFRKWLLDEAAVYQRQP